MQNFVLRALVLGLLAAGSSSSATPLSFTGLGHPYGVYASTAAGVSADGSTVIGVMSATVPGTGGGFRWTSAGGFVLVGGTPTAVSADGSVVVGGTPSGVPFRWTSAGTEPLVSTGGHAHDISDTGALIVGECFGFAADLQTGVCRNLGAGTSANAVSGNGLVIAGVTHVPVVGFAGWRRVGTFFFDLGDLPGGDLDMSPTDVSFDGAVVVGSGRSASGFEAFRWTSATGIVGLGDLPGGAFQSFASSVSADGSVVVGRGRSASGDEPFIWNAAKGMRELDRYLGSLGIDLGGWILEDVSGISADGRTLVGHGLNEVGLREAWLAQIPESSTLSLLAPSLAALAIARRRLR